MRGKIRLPDGTEASLDDGIWVSDDEGIQSILNMRTILLGLRTGPQRPDVDGEILRQIAQLESAEIIEDTPPKFVRDRVY